MNRAYTVIPASGWRKCFNLESCEPTPGDVQSGVYFFSQSGTVVYVGKSTNIQLRLAAHPILKELQSGPVSIYVLQIDPQHLDCVEAFMIWYYRPHKNCTLIKYNDAYDQKVRTDFDSALESMGVMDPMGVPSRHNTGTPLCANTLLMRLRMAKSICAVGCRSVADSINESRVYVKAVLNGQIEPSQDTLEKLAAVAPQILQRAQRKIDRRKNWFKDEVAL